MQTIPEMSNTDLLQSMIDEDIYVQAAINTVADTPEAELLKQAAIDQHAMSLLEMLEQYALRVNQGLWDLGTFYPQYLGNVIEDWETIIGTPFGGSNPNLKETAVTAPIAEKNESPHEIITVQKEEKSITDEQWILMAAISVVMVIFIFILIKKLN